MNKTVFIFPGQGSQYVGMGADFTRNIPKAQEVFAKADEILGFSLSGLCFEGPAELLNRTKFTQPAIFAASIAIFEVLKDRGVSYGAAAGHSLGEYTALVAAGVLGFTDALKIVQKRAELMEKACLREQGGMVAILGLDREAVQEICDQASKKGVVQPANYNAPRQVVISGTCPGLEEAARLARRAGARMVTPLSVNGPFHSSLMAQAGNILGDFLQGFHFTPPSVSFVTNVTGNYLREPETIRSCLAEQVSSPVLWEESVNCLAQDGFNVFIEVGPGQILSGLVKRIVPQCRFCHVKDMASLEKLLAQ